jgi:hypothetical protein
VHNALDLVQVVNALGNLKNDVACEVFGEVGEFDNLMEQLAARPAVMTASA